MFEKRADGSIRLVSTPGHSPGHLSVLLRTATGPVLVVGDAAYTRRAIAEGHDQIARADPAAYQTSLESLRRWTGEHPAAPIICSHDYEFWKDAPHLSIPDNATAKDPGTAQVVS